MAEERALIVQRAWRARAARRNAPILDALVKHRARFQALLD